MTHIALTLSNYLQSPINELLNILRNLSSKAINVLEITSEEYIKSRDIKATIKELESLSNAELRDIGICRGDIEQVARGNTGRRL